MNQTYAAILSQLLHLVAFSSRKPRTRLDKGVLVISIDIDVGSKWIGEKNRGCNDANVDPYLSECAIGKIEEEALPILIRFFEKLEIPVTFAVRGQLTERDDSVLELIKGSCVNHDIGAHGYYHRVFTGLSEDEAEKELKMISVGMRRFHIEPKSFVFPKNKIAHLHLLEKYGYRCYRGFGTFISDDLSIQRHSQLYDVHPGFFLGSSPYSIFLDKIIDIAARKRLPFHVWFHAHDLGDSDMLIQQRIARVLLPFLKYAKKMEKEGRLSFETMYSIVKRIEQNRGQAT